jgi:proteasome beta subunit
MWPAAVSARMGTVVGLRLADGVALAADRRATDGSTVRSDDLGKLFAFDAAGAGATGSAGAIQEFGRRLEDELRRLRDRQDRGPSIDALERLAGDAASGAGAEAVVAARDGEGVASLRAIDAEGGAVEDEVLALGTGAQVALGGLEGIDPETSVEEADELLESVLEGVAERDAETGSSVDVWTLTDR